MDAEQRIKELEKELKLAKSAISYLVPVDFTGNRTFTFGTDITGWNDKTSVGVSDDEVFDYVVKVKEEA